MSGAHSGVVEVEQRMTKARAGTRLDGVAQGFVGGTEDGFVSIRLGGGVIDGFAGLGHIEPQCRQFGAEFRRGHP
jgi:hypothetical protein